MSVRPLKASANPSVAGHHTPTSRGQCCHHDSTGWISSRCPFSSSPQRTSGTYGTLVQPDVQRGDASAQGGRSCFWPRRWSELRYSGKEKTETILEQQRRYHEERERLMDVMAKEMLTKKSTEQRHLTHENVQRKQARTGEEREEEEEEQISESESEDEENEIIYNPKNLPLGWDGKPIPYWLYKLHGLNINYNGEICGNYTYRGPKAFQRHFACGPS
ncbi:uncharacterized protein ACIGJ3_004736 isoform 2-T2 [Trichechus inunguis]